MQGQKHTTHKGSTATVILGIMIFIMIFAMFFLELLRIFDTQYAIVVRAQRAINSTVELAMNDKQRADGYNYMYYKTDHIPNDGRTVAQALDDYLQEDLAIDRNGIRRDASGRELYRVSYDVNSAIYDTGNPSYHGGTRNQAGISIPITVTISSKYTLFDGVARLFKMEFENTYKSTNFRTDKDERAGWR